MILASLFSPALAIAVFFGTLRQRGPGRAEREAASHRFRDGPRIGLIVLALVIPLVTVGAVRVLAERADWFQPLELR